VLEVCQTCASWGCELTLLPVDKYGRIHLEDLRNSIKENTLLVSLMAANNEVGTLHPIAEVGAITQNAGVLFHVDAAQAAGKIPIDVEAMNIDFLSLSAHKMYGPKGVGALYKSKQAPELEPLLYGGHQEGGLRPGTANVPGIVGMGKACELCLQNLEEESQRLTSMRDHLIQSVLAQTPCAQLNGHPTERLCNNVSFSFKDLSPDEFALGLSGLAVSSGSACTSGDAKPSHVLCAMGHDDLLAKATLRIGIGRYTQPTEVQTAIEKVVKMAGPLQHEEAGTS
jgi:cysteine desulfurase